MSTSPTSARLRAVLREKQSQVAAILATYGAAEPRLFGSVARGEALHSSDIDLLVDLLPDRGNELMRIAGIAEELSNLLGVRVDVVADGLLRPEVSATALADAVPV